MKGEEVLFAARQHGILGGVTIVRNANQDLGDVILGIYLHKLVDDVDADDILCQRHCVALRIRVKVSQMLE